MVIGVDFDGTCTTHEFPFIGKEIGAVPVLKKLIKSGHKLVLFTMRSNSESHDGFSDEIPEVHTGPFLNEAIKWFQRNKIELYGVQENPTQKKWTTSPKAYCHLYIDDAALGCPLTFNRELSDRPFVNWIEVENILKSMRIIQ